MGGVPRTALAAALVAAAPLAAGCVAYTPTPSDACGEGPSWSDRIVAEDPGLAGALAAAATDARARAPANATSEAGPAWTGVPATVTVVEGEALHHARIAPQAPWANATLTFQDHPELGAYGPSVVDQVTWFPETSPSPHVAYEGPDRAEANGSLMFRFLPQVGDPGARERMAQAFVTKLFPEGGDDLVPEDLSSPRPHEVASEPDAAGFLGEVLEQGNVTVTAEPAAPDAFPRADGVVVIEAPGPGDASGLVEVRLVHEVHAVAAPGATPPVSLQATPQGKVTLSAYADEPVGEEALLSTAEAHLDGVEGLDLAPLGDGVHEAAPSCPAP